MVAGRGGIIFSNGVATGGIGRKRRGSEKIRGTLELKRM